MAKPYVYNRRAARDYSFIEKYEAGIKLKGYEVKAVKNNQASLQGAFITVKGDELYLTNMYIAPYQEANIPGKYDEYRPRKLMMHKKEIEELKEKRQQKGLTLVPIKLYNKKGLIKVEFALGKGKKEYDKRETIKKREDDRKIRRTLKNKTR